MPPTAKRVSKPASQRRTEILNAAHHLFITKGIQATSVEDILTEVGIAKGTLYYHFSSKDDILRSLVERTTARVSAQARAVADSPMPAIPKFLAVMAAARAEDSEIALAAELHTTGHDEFHLMSILGTIRALTPILVGVVEEGIAEGSFTTDHPREVIEIILTAAGMLLDTGIFIGEEDQIPRRTAGLIHAAEVLLGTQPGALAQAMEGTEGMEDSA